VKVKGIYFFRVQGCEGEIDRQRQRDKRVQCTIRHAIGLDGLVVWRSGFFDIIGTCRGEQA
jgi:hypothetical protein